jgi:regulatory protein
MKSRPAFLASKSSSENKAFNKLCDLLSRRDHSLKELKEKLSQRFESAAIDSAIQKADEYGYLKDPQEISERLAEALHFRNRGYKKIEFELQKKGLPPVEVDLEREAEKARELLDKLIKKSDDLDFKAKQKAMRSLASRGFLMDTIRQVTDEKF